MQLIPIVRIKQSKLFYTFTVVNADAYQVFRDSEYFRQIGTSRNK